ncbi:MAG: DUF309 domain-containing protein [Gemmataceae bacterium]
MSRDRVLLDWPIPAYTHIPGKTPHPHSDPAGHRHPVPSAEPYDPARWDQCPAYLHGIDLFDSGFFWEAHEAWEQLWHAVGRCGPDADLVKGLIQLAVAGVKHLQEMPESMRWHAKRAAELLASCRTPEYRGLDIAKITKIATSIADDGWLPSNKLSACMPEH